MQHGVGGGEHSQWEIAEVAMWKQRLTDAQCEELADYYIDRYGLTPNGGSAG